MIKRLLPFVLALVVWKLNAQEFERYKVLPDTAIRSVALEYKKNMSIIVPTEYQDNIPDQGFPLIVIFDR